MTTTNTVKSGAWQRLSIVIEKSGLTVSSFAKVIGLKRAENLYQIKRGCNNISLQLATAINARFPAYSVAWLVCGDGATRSRTDRVLRIPVYDSPPFERKPDDYLSLTTSAACGADHAFSFLINISNFCLLSVRMLLKKCEGEMLSGHLYLISTLDTHLLGTVRYDPDHSKLRLITLWPDALGEVVIEHKDILYFWQVCGAVCKLHE